MEREGERDREMEKENNQLWDRMIIWVGLCRETTVVSVQRDLRGESGGDAPMGEVGIESGWARIGRVIVLDALERHQLLGQLLRGE